MRKKVGSRTALFNYKKSRTDNLGDELKHILAGRNGTCSASPDTVSS